MLFAWYLGDGVGMTLELAAVAVEKKFAHAICTVQRVVVDSVDD